MMGRAGHKYSKQRAMNRNYRNQKSGYVVCYMSLKHSAEYFGKILNILIKLSKLFETYKSNMSKSTISVGDIMCVNITAADTMAVNAARVSAGIILTLSSHSDLPPWTPRFTICIPIGSWRPVFT